MKKGKIAISIDKSLLNKEISIKGQVTKVTETPGLYLINIKDSSNKEITVIVFKEDDLRLQKDDLVQVEGTVKDYKGNLEIVAEKIEVY